MKKQIINKQKKISVCIASYNGSKFIREQLESILNQISRDDEIIVVDDCSSDNTVEIIKGFRDLRIKLYLNEFNVGACRSFARAIDIANGYFIFLADQDDVWCPNRVEKMLAVFDHDDVLLVSTAFDLFGEKLNDDYVRKFLFLKEEDSNKNFKNIINIFLGRASYFGCAMVFRKSFRSMILPIPNYVQSHDLWIAKAANLLGVNKHSEIITLSRRIHGNNLSVVSNSLMVKLYARFIFLLSLVHLFGRLCFKKLTNIVG